MTSVECPYCGTTDTTDCGEIGNGERHFECHGCRCGFAKEQDGDRDPDSSQDELCDLLRFNGEPF